MESKYRYKIDKESIVYRLVGGEAVMLNIDNGCYYSLDEVGTRIWKCIEANKCISEIVDIIKEEYIVVGEKAKKDILKLINRLEKVKLIKRV